jgi:hypothetical protein
MYLRVLRGENVIQLIYMVFYIFVEYLDSCIALDTLDTLDVLVRRQSVYGYTSYIMQ